MEHIEIIQYIYTGDEIMTINSLKNGMILTGGVNVNQGNRKYYIRQFILDIEMMMLDIVMKKRLKKKYLIMLKMINIFHYLLHMKHLKLLS